MIWCATEPGPTDFDFSCDESAPSTPYAAGPSASLCSTATNAAKKAKLGAPKGPRALKWWQYSCMRDGQKYYFKSRHPAEYTVRSDRSWKALERRAEEAEVKLKERTLPDNMYDKDSGRKDASSLSPVAVSCRNARGA